MSLKLNLYKDCLHKVRRNKCRGIVINAKPCLLLAVIENISKGIIKDNIIIFNEELLDVYKIIWGKLSFPISVTPMWKPFFFLTSDGFWHLMWKNQSSKISSAKSLKNNIEYAYLDEDLWNLMMDISTRQIIKDEILEIIREN